MPNPLLVSILGAPASGRDTLLLGLVEALQRTGVRAAAESSLSVAQHLPTARRFGAYLQRRLTDLSAVGVEVVVTDAPFLWPCLDGSLDPALANPDTLAYLTELHLRTPQLTYLVHRTPLCPLNPSLQQLHATTAAFTAHLRESLAEFDLPFTELTHPVDLSAQLVNPVRRALQAMHANLVHAA